MIWFERSNVVLASNLLCKWAVLVNGCIDLLANHQQTHTSNECNLISSVSNSCKHSPCSSSLASLSFAFNQAKCVCIYLHIDHWSKETTNFIFYAFWLWIHVCHTLLYGLFISRYHYKHVKIKMGFSFFTNIDFFFSGKNIQKLTLKKILSQQCNQIKI